jgi:hypothetical protein
MTSQNPSQAHLVALHLIYQKVVEEYHPFADYLGFEDTPEGTVICYRSTFSQDDNDNQFMLLNSQREVIADTTFGTARTANVIGAILDALADGNVDNRYKK